MPMCVCVLMSPSCAWKQATCGFSGICRGEWVGGGLSSSKRPRARALGLSDGAAHVTVSKPLIYPLPFLHATVRSDSLDLWGPTRPLVPTDDSGPGQLTWCTPSEDQSQTAAQTLGLFCKP